MTTVFGLRHEEIGASILVADRQSTSIDEKSGIAYGKFLGRKLWASKNENYCFGHSGKFDKEMGNLVKKLCDGEIDIEKIIDKKYFNELRKLNLKRMGKKIPNLQELSGLILATRFKKNPKLYTCFPLGSIEEKGWTCMGSGEQKITEYIQSLNIISEAKDYLGNNWKTKMEDLIRIGLEAVRRSQSQDLYSHGLDMIICTPEGMNDHYSDLGDDFGKHLKKIQRMYKSRF